MSCYIVLTEQIDAILTTAIKARAYVKFPDGGYDYVASHNASTVGQILVNENYRSVNYRYRQQDEAPEYYYRPYRKELSAVAILKLVNNYMYQACEHPDWEKSDAFKISERIKDSLINKLPGYDEAEWGL